MSEVNGPKFGVNQVNFQNVQKQTPDNLQAEEESPKLKDFSDPKAEALGRSMLIKDADNTDHDLNVLLKNPQIAENSDKMFETALKAAEAAGIEHSYEKAATFSTGV